MEHNLVRNYPPSCSEWRIEEEQRQFRPYEDIRGHSSIVKWLKATISAILPAALVVLTGCGGSITTPSPSASLLLSTTILTFGNQQVGMTSPAQAVTLTNNAQVDLAIGSIATAGDFQQTNDCSRSLSPGASCIIKVTFTPSAIGVRTGALAVDENVGGSRQQIALSGSGVKVTPSGTPVSDDFHDSSLSTSLWTVVAPCCGSVRMNRTDAQLFVPAVTNHDIWTYGDRAVRLMQNVSNTDFEVVTKFDSPVTVVGQLEGMIVEQDTQNLIRVDVSWSGTQTKLYVATFAAMVPTTQYFNAVAIPYGTAPLWIKVKRVGNNWTQSWSIDGVNFNVGAVFSYSLNVTRMGPYAGTSGNTSTGTPAPNFTASVDYFFNTASPITPADGGMAQPANQPLINVWYGDTQNFGQNGTPQTWVNILGNVSAPAGIKTLTYSLNGGAEQFLRVGPNKARLVDIGDFNVEIDHASLVGGANTVRITATDNNGVQAIHNVTINYTAGKTWPLPYSINWSTVTNIQDVAQIVDGLWAIQPDGTVRTLQTGYDRVIAIGDMSWTDYVVTSEITINALDCYAFGAGLVVGWTGHTTDPNMPQPDQPRTGHPFFGLGWYATTGTERAPNAQLNIYANSRDFPETVLAQDTSGWKPVLGLKYIFKFQVTRNSNGTSHFALKVWPATNTEPSKWNLQADGDPSHGSVLLGAYQADMSFGRITINPLP